MSSDPNENVQIGSVPLADGEVITWEHLEDLALLPANGDDPGSLTPRERAHDSARTCGDEQKMDTNSEDGESQSHRAEDVRTQIMSENITRLKIPTGSAVLPALFVSQASSDRLIMMQHHSSSNTWANAADVPTRPTSSSSQELPPLTRCPQSTFANFPSVAYNYDGSPVEDAPMSDDTHFPVSGDLTPARRMDTLRADPARNKNDKKDDSLDKNRFLQFSCDKRS